MPNPAPGTRAHAEWDLAAFINHQGETGEMEIDPYGYAATVIAVVLQYALDDGINGAMNQYEMETLEGVALWLMERDPDLAIEPRIG